MWSYERMYTRTHTHIYIYERINIVNYIFMLIRTNWIVWFKIERDA